mmetsp:Transcript_33086/g.82277  ORF Transcript_33086/g.82277 Transcript_33086/m.82277 type:complete len:230 (+) Transcript_33086:784-1473(+)
MVLLGPVRADVCCPVSAASPHTPWVSAAATSRPMSAAQCPQRILAVTDSLPHPSAPVASTPSFQNRWRFCTLPLLKGGHKSPLPLPLLLRLLPPSSLLLLLLLSLLLLLLLLLLRCAALFKTAHSPGRSLLSNRRVLTLHWHSWLAQVSHARCLHTSREVQLAAVAKLAAAAKLAACTPELHCALFARCVTIRMFSKFLNGRAVRKQAPHFLPDSSGLCAQPLAPGLFE